MLQSITGADQEERPLLFCACSHGTFIPPVCQVQHWDDMELIWRHVYSEMKVQALQQAESISSEAMTSSLPGDTLQACCVRN